MKDKKKLIAKIAIGAGILLLLFRVKPVFAETVIAPESLPETEYIIPEGTTDVELMNIMFPPVGTAMALKAKLAALEVAMKRLREKIG